VSRQKNKDRSENIRFLIQTKNDKKRLKPPKLKTPPINII